MPEPALHDVSEGGPERPPSSFPVRLMRGLVGLVILVAVVWGMVALLSSLPEGTRAPALALRAAIGLAAGGSLIFVVRRMLRALTEPPPPPAPTVDARTADVVYECPVCGTRLRLEVAATAKAPRHCGEEMEARIG